MTDEILAGLATDLLLDQLAKLRAAPTPLPYGLYQRFTSFAPESTVEQLVQREAHWHRYAETVGEFNQLLNDKGHVPFVEKSKRK